MWKAFHFSKCAIIHNSYWAFYFSNYNIVSCLNLSLKCHKWIGLLAFCHNRLKEEHTRKITKEIIKALTRSTQYNQQSQVMIWSPTIVYNIRIINYPILISKKIVKPTSNTKKPHLNTQSKNNPYKLNSKRFSTIKNGKSSSKGDQQYLYCNVSIPGVNLLKNYLEIDKDKTRFLFENQVLQVKRSL